MKQAEKEQERLKGALIKYVDGWFFFSFGL
jgi:hypothetical protein